MAVPVTFSPGVELGRRVKLCRWRKPLAGRVEPVFRSVRAGETGRQQNVGPVNSILTRVISDM